ncbi:MAG: EFR1 family ferrodoxin [Candidatus Thermoplasmatota archaeon]|nr:EFR1 family ferrodoxin [Candidatus Thermoplasmatota archaeon]
MEKPEIYFFSGTGNSFSVAKDIADRINGKIIPVISLMKQDIIHTDADVIGVVFPIYDFKAPVLIDNFIKKLANIDSKYIFAVCTYGLMPLKTMKKLEKTITSCGGKLSGGFTVKMPHNGISYEKFKLDKQNKLLNNWKIKCESVVDYINARKVGTIEKNSSFHLIIMVGIFIKALPKFMSLFKQVITKGWDSFALFADEKCNGCGICEKVCPMENITMIENKPSWSDKCMICFACLHWCPWEAIQAGNLTQKMKRYHHPKVKMNDIINQKRRNI